MEAFDKAYNLASVASLASLAGKRNKWDMAKGMLPKELFFLIHHLQGQKGHQVF